MKFHMKHISKYREILVEDGNTTISSGLLDEGEARETAKELISAAEDLLSGTNEAEALCLIRESL